MHSKRSLEGRRSQAELGNEGCGNRRGVGGIVAAIICICLSASPPAFACPFCRSVSETLSDKLNLAEIAIIATRRGPDVTAAKAPPKGPRAQEYAVGEVLKGKDLLAGATKIAAPPLADVPEGAKLLILGARDKKTDKEIYWFSPHVISERGIDYVKKLPTAPAKTQAVDRLAFFMEYLNDADNLIADDAYDEFALASFADVKALAPRLRRDKLLGWVQDAKTPVLRRRQFLTLLAACGNKDDAAVLEKMVAGEHGGQQGALDATAACYLTLAGEPGLKLLEKEFIQNDKAPPSDGQAIVMALRFLGEEQNAIGEKLVPRPRLLETLRLYLDRPAWADQVLPELARWEDWSSLPKLVKLFQEADKLLPNETAAFALRVPIIKYLRACPLPEAKTRLAELEESHADVVRAADLYPFLPAARADTSPRRTKTPGKSKTAAAESKSHEPKTKDAGEAKTKDEDDNDADAPAKTKPRKLAKRKTAANSTWAHESDAPVIGTGLGLLAGTAAALGLVVAILFSFRGK